MSDPAGQQDRAPAQGEPTLQVTPSGYHQVTPSGYRVPLAATQVIPAIPLEMKEVLAQIVLEATADGVMDLDLLTGVAKYSTRWKFMLGYEEHELLDIPELLYHLTHPDDKETLRAKIAEHLQSFFPLSHTFRMRHRAGEYRWLLCRAMSTCAADGRPVRLIGVFSDQTDRMRSEERHRALAAAIPDMILRVRIDGAILEFKPSEQPMAIAMPSPKIGSTLQGWTPAASWKDQAMAALGRALDKRAIQTFEMSATAADGGARQMEVRLIDSGPDEALLILRDITGKQR